MDEYQPLSWGCSSWDTTTAPYLRQNYKWQLIITLSVECLPYSDYSDCSVWLRECVASVNQISLACAKVTEGVCSIKCNLTRREFHREPRTWLTEHANSLNVWDVVLRLSIQLAINSTNLWKCIGQTSGFESLQSYVRAVLASRKGRRRAAYIDESYSTQMRKHKTPRGRQRLNFR